MPAAKQPGRRPDHLGATPRLNRHMRITPRSLQARAGQSSAERRAGQAFLAHRALEPLLLRLTAA